MYVPEFFVENDPAEIERIITTFPLATIVANGDGGLFAAHIPLLRSGKDKLIGHIALNNPMHRDIPDGSDVLAIFRANDAYVSPNWYPSKQDHHKFVPTWNYQAIHFNGAIRFDHSEKFKRAVVGRLTKHFETRTNGAEGWRMADAPAEYLSAMITNIVGFEITINAVIAKSKLSQNREKGDFDNVVRKLGETGSESLAAAMRRSRNRGPDPSK